MSPVEPMKYENMIQTFYQYETYTVHFHTLVFLLCS